MTSAKKEEVRVFLGPGVMSKPAALANNIEKLMMEANQMGLEGRILLSVKTKAEWGEGTFAVLVYEAKPGGFIKA